MSASERFSGQIFSWLLWFCHYLTIYSCWVIILFYFLLRCSLLARCRLIEPLKICLSYHPANYYSHHSSHLRLLMTSSRQILYVFSWFFCAYGRSNSLCSSPYLAKMTQLSHPISQPRRCSQDCFWGWAGPCASWDSCCNCLGDLLENFLVCPSCRGRRYFCCDRDVGTWPRFAFACLWQTSSYPMSGARPCCPAGDSPERSQSS